MAEQCRKIKDPEFPGIEFLGPVKTGDKIRIRQTWGLNLDNPKAPRNTKVTLLEIQNPYWARSTVELDTAPGAEWPGFVLIQEFLGVQLLNTRSGLLHRVEVIDG